MRRIFQEVMVAVAGGLIVAVAVSFTTSLKPIQLAEVFGLGLVACFVLIAATAHPLVRRWRSRRPPLKVTVPDHHFHDWNYAASVGAIHVVIRNRAGISVELSEEVKYQCIPTATPGWSEVLTERDKKAFEVEVGSQKRSSHHLPNLRDMKVVPAHAKVDAWVIVTVSRHQDQSRPRIKIFFGDTFGFQYTAETKPDH